MVASFLCYLRAVSPCSRFLHVPMLTLCLKSHRYSAPRQPHLHACPFSGGPQQLVSTCGCDDSSSRSWRTHQPGSHGCQPHVGDAGMGRAFHHRWLSGDWLPAAASSSDTCGSGGPGPRLADRLRWPLHCQHLRHAPAGLQLHGAHVCAQRSGHRQVQCGPALHNCARRTAGATAGGGRCGARGEAACCIVSGC